MRKVSAINIKRNIPFSVFVNIFILLCLLAMFQVPSMTMQGASTFSIAGTNIFSIGIIGFAIGCYGTIIGIGGGPLIVPILVMSYGWESEFLVATSLFIVFLNAASGTAAYSFQKRIDYKGGLKFALAALPGAIVSGFIHHNFHIRIFDLIFGVFLVLLAIYSMLSIKKIDVTKKNIPRPPEGKRFRHIRIKDNFGVNFSFYSNDKLGISMNLLLGFFVGFLGIGGGVFQVPILLFLLKYPAHIATATSHFVTMLTCLFALIPHIYLGNIYFMEAFWMGLGILVGAQAGAFFAPKIKSKALIYLYVIVLFVFAFKLLF